MPNLTDLAQSLDALDLLTSNDSTAGDDAVLKDLARCAVDGKPSTSVYANDGYNRLMQADVSIVLQAFNGLKAVHKGGNNDTKAAHTAAMMYGATHNTGVIGGRLILAAHNGDVDLTTGAIVHKPTAINAVSKWSKGSRIHTCKGESAKPRKAQPFGASRWIDAPNAMRVYTIESKPYVLWCLTAHGASEREYCAPSCLQGLMGVDSVTLYTDKPNYAQAIGKPIGLLGDVLSGNATGEYSANDGANESTSHNPLAMLDAKVADIDASLANTISGLEAVRATLGDSVIDGAIADATAQADAEKASVLANKQAVSEAVHTIANSAKQLANLDDLKGVLTDNQIQAARRKVESAIVDAEKVLADNGLTLADADSDSDSETDVDDTTETDESALADADSALDDILNE